MSNGLATKRILTIFVIGIFIFVLLFSFYIWLQPVLSGQYAYVAEQVGTISVIDTQTDKVAATIYDGSFHFGVAVNPMGDRVYVTNYVENSISVIDTTSYFSLFNFNRVIANIPVGAEPNGVAVNSNGSRVYVTNTRDGTVSVIDALNNTVIATVPVGNIIKPARSEGGKWYRAEVYGWPYGIVVNPAGDKIYVTNIDDGNVSVIDAATNKVNATIQLGGKSLGVAVTPDGTKIFVASDNYTYVIDANTNTVTSKLNVGIHPMGVVVNPAGTRVYVANRGSDSVSVIDVKSDSVIATVQVGSGPQGISVTPDGTKVYTANCAGNTVSVIDAATNTVIATVQVKNYPHAFGQFISPDT